MRKNKQVNLPAAAVAGGVGAMIIAFLMSMILAWLGVKAVLPQESIYRSAPAILTSSVFVASWIAGTRVSKKEAIISVLGTASVYCILTLAVKVICLKGAPLNFTRNLIYILVGSVSALFILLLTG